jgi:hypothetical protein
MGNAPNRMTRRLAITIASYISRFGAWPTEARLSPDALYLLVQTLDREHFDRLANRLKLRLTRDSDIAVGGSAGHLVYDPSEGLSAAVIESVERELAFDELTFDPPSEALIDLTASLYGQEVFHQLVLQELLARTDLGSRLGIWDDDVQPPTVLYEPRRGLFDLGLAKFAGGTESPVEVFIELKVGSHLEMGQVERQREGADGARRAYLLLGPTYFRWRDLTEATVLGLTEVASAVGSVGATYTGSIGELARVYGDRLGQEAQRWSQPMDPAVQWDALDHFRFYAEIAAAWPVPVNIYPVTNRSGQQYVLNAPSAWAHPSAAEWRDGRVYWEIINARLRYKLTWDGPTALGYAMREAWRDALRRGAAEYGETLDEPRSSGGRAMTAGELGGDLRTFLVQGGQVDIGEARTLYDRATAVFRAAFRRLEGEYDPARNHPVTATSATSALAEPDAVESRDLEAGP